MQPDSAKYLFDIRRAARLIAGLCSGRSFQDYVADDMLKSAVERQFGIIGEALARLAKTDSVVAAQVTDYRRIVAFRNILVHGYATVDDRIPAPVRAVWCAVPARAGHHRRAPHPADQPGMTRREERLAPLLRPPRAKLREPSIELRAGKPNPRLDALLAREELETAACVHAQTGFDGVVHVQGYAGTGDRAGFCGVWFYKNGMVVGLGAAPGAGSVI